MTRWIRVPCFLICVAYLPAACPARADEPATKAGEYWEAIFMGEDKVGYARTTTRAIKENGRNAVQVQVETLLSIKRAGQTVQIKREFNSVETPEGKLIRFENRDANSRTRGDVLGKSLKITIETQGKQTSRELPWDEEVLGPSAEERVIAKTLKEPGQKRTFRTFMPDLNQPVTTTLEAEEMEEVAMLDGPKQKLRRVRSQIDDVPALKNIKSTAWLNEEGEAVKKFTDVLVGMTTYRTTKERAMSPSGTPSGDLLVQSLVRVDKKIPRPYEANEIVYRLKLQGEPPEKVFPQDERQTLSKGADGESLLTVRSVDSASPLPPLAAGKLAEFMRSNNWIQTEDDRVLLASKNAVGNATDAMEKARRIEKWVHQNLANKNFSNEFDSAAEVAKKLEGDCTEHAVLVAAMARVAGIPSRVAVGLVYAERLNAFAFHAWNELYMNGHWIPFDGTLGLGHASPTHLKLADSSLDGVDFRASFLPVVQVMAKLKLEVVSWKHANGG